ncbi:MAG: hypothetical protein QF492_01655 [Candidatus Krumholzibacteria bacterium]|jgi:hypothetical protein|nr:hypothetical protein [Candidatus Krumholzibacteria bacterium]MDP6668599.1 hypothetical protein [Candidatus Krumholzibacteria bacterium]MDP6796230.1 hypothetical protein [Candidatus Krumholzibacteria bacterium]MDP7021333.1 hypothetical protein [Candidatus Krumholzibacteria bacterium]
MKRAWIVTILLVSGLLWMSSPLLSAPLKQELPRIHDSSLSPPPLPPEEGGDRDSGDDDAPGETVKRGRRMGQTESPPVGKPPLLRILLRIWILLP